ncbi:MORC family CW-type zinc finger protein 2 [Elysia marginata]|uniref:MORC family CW-type zinc finger protein 2 n=1 Tax=Elysia marginata TaxID=1093978 RepID=A0AAV4HBT5_9GAST|nr:MORC family CW-type zinc finger protein 2 [Elysia marginata]
MSFIIIIIELFLLFGIRFDKSGGELKFLDSKAQENCSVAPSSPSSQEGTEAPTSSTATPAVTGQLVSNFQTEASLRKQESEEAKAKLVEVRKLIAKLLKSTNEDFDLDPEEAGDQVDELLAACVKQATSQQT